MAKYSIERYDNGSDTRKKIVVHEGVVWITYAYGGMGMDSKCLEAGDEWYEGSDELMGVYETAEETHAAIDRHFG